MKKIAHCVLFSILLSSCTNVWNESNDKTFHKACLDEAKTWTGTQAKGETYCDCVIAKVKEKYPNEDDALKNIGSLSTDKELQACKDLVMKK